MTTGTAAEPDTGGGAPDFDRCYRAVQARDARFDGQFFVTVRTTGIYCRPSCPAQTPRPGNVAFVLTAAAAQQQGFRACRRCAPDAVPGSPLWNINADMSARAMRLIADGVVEREGVEGLATRLRYSPRHLTRVLTRHLGAGPLALARAHRATNARVLIQCTTMPMTDIAFAAGFASVRQFNDTVRAVFGLTPTELRRLPSRKRNPNDDNDSAPGSVTLRLPFRAPYRWPWMRWFLHAHAAAGVESVVDAPGSPHGWRYRRVLALPHGPASAEVEPRDDHAVVSLRGLDMRDLGVAVNRIRRLLDLDADITAVQDALAADDTMRRLLDRASGLRAPGSLDPAETIIRTMLGQQVSLAAARNQIDRLVDVLGEPVGDSLAVASEASTADDDPPSKSFPTPSVIAARGHEVLRGPRRRVDAVIAVAEALAEGRMEPHVGVDASDLRAQLLELPGIGPWTADIVTMRVTGDPDVLLTNDLVVVRAAADLGIDLRDTGHWAPWRSYATMHLWRHRLDAAGQVV